MPHRHFLFVCKHSVIVMQCRCWTNIEPVVVACPPSCDPKRWPTPR